MEVLAKHEKTADGRSMKDSDREELQSALNRMMEAAALWKRERAQLVAACDQLRRQLSDSEATTAAWERQCIQLKETRDHFQQELSSGQTEADSWKQERAQLLALISDSEEGAGIALERQVTAAIDRVRGELTAENDKLRAELQRTTEEFSQAEVERSRLVAEVERANSLLADTEEAAAIALERQISAAVTQVRAELATEVESMREEIHRLQGELNNASGSSQHAADITETLRKEFSSERDRLRQDLDAAMQLCARRTSESAELAAERDRLKQAIADAAEAQAREATEVLQREIASAVERARAGFEDETQGLRNQMESERARLMADLDAATALLTEAQAAYASAVSDKKDAERKVDEIIKDRDQLRVRLEQAADDAAQRELERNHLKEEYERASQILEEAKAVRPEGIAGVTTELVIAEEVRIEEHIRELSALIDDPGTELSAVIRKTVERAQLDFYLKGLRFSATGESPTAH